MVASEISNYKSRNEKVGMSLIFFGEVLTQHTIVHSIIIRILSAQLLSLSGK